jgi:hypothetical protein
MKDVAIENKEFTAEMNQKVINLNDTINDYKIDMESSFDDLKNDLKLEMNEKIKNIEDYCVNLTITSGQLIDEFKKEVAIENKEFAAKMNKKEININNAIHDHKTDVESSFFKTKKTLSNLENIILKDRTGNIYFIHLTVTILIYVRICI